MRKFFASIEVVFAVVLAIAAIKLYVSIRFDSATVDLIAKLSDNIQDYKKVTENGRTIVDSTWKNVPHWRETLIAGRNALNKSKTVCDDYARKISPPKDGWKKMITPQSVIDTCNQLSQVLRSASETCERLDGNLKEFLDTLDTNLSEEQQQQTIQAFDNTLVRLNETEQSLAGIQSEISIHSGIALIILLAMSICFFANGMFCILENRSAQERPDCR